MALLARKAYLKVLQLRLSSLYFRKPIVITDRVHDITEVVPGVSIGPQFWDGQSGNTLTEGYYPQPLTF